MTKFSKILYSGAALIVGLGVAHVAVAQITQDWLNATGDQLTDAAETVTQEQINELVNTTNSSGTSALDAVNAIEQSAREAENAANNANSAITSLTNLANGTTGTTGGSGSSSGSGTGSSSSSSSPLDRLHDAANSTLSNTAGSGSGSGGTTDLNSINNMVNNAAANAQSNANAAQNNLSNLANSAANSGGGSGSGEESGEEPPLDINDKRPEGFKQELGTNDSTTNAYNRIQDASWRASNSSQTVTKTGGSGCSGSSSGSSGSSTSGTTASPSGSSAGTTTPTTSINADALDSALNSGADAMNRAKSLGISDTITQNPDLLPQAISGWENARDTAINSRNLDGAMRAQDRIDALTDLKKAYDAANDALSSPSGSSGGTTTPSTNPSLSTTPSLTDQLNGINSRLDQIDRKLNSGTPLAGGDAEFEALNNERQGLLNSRADIENQLNNQSAGTPNTTPDVTSSIRDNMRNRLGEINNRLNEIDQQLNDGTPLGGKSELTALNNEKQNLLNEKADIENALNTPAETPTTETPDTGDTDVTPVGESPVQAEDDLEDEGAGEGGAGMTSGIYVDPVRLVLAAITPFEQAKTVDEFRNVIIRAAEIGDAMGAIDQTGMNLEGEGGNASTPSAAAEYSIALLQATPIDVARWVSMDYTPVSTTTTTASTPSVTPGVTASNNSTSADALTPTSNNLESETDTNSGTDGTEEYETEIKARRVELARQYANVGTQIAEGMNAISSDFPMRAQMLVAEISAAVSNNYASTIGAASDVAREALIESLRATALSCVELGVAASQVLLRADVHAPIKDEGNTDSGNTGNGNGQ